MSSCLSRLFALLSSPLLLRPFKNSLVDKHCSTIRRARTNSSEGNFKDSTWFLMIDPVARYSCYIRSKLNDESYVCQNCLSSEMQGEMDGRRRVVGGRLRTVADDETGSGRERRGATSRNGRRSKQCLKSRHPSSFARPPSLS